MISPFFPLARAAPRVDAPSAQRPWSADRTLYNRLIRWGAYDTDSQFGGLLFLFDPSAKRYKLELGGPVIPRFQAGASL